MKEILLTKHNTLPRYMTHLSTLQGIVNGIIHVVYCLTIAYDCFYKRICSQLTLLTFIRKLFFENSRECQSKSACKNKQQFQALNITVGFPRISLWNLRVL